jgi:hypothetical protein
VPVAAAPSLSPPPPAPVRVETLPEPIRMAWDDAVAAADTGPEPVAPTISWRANGDGTPPGA